MVSHSRLALVFFWCGDFFKSVDFDNTNLFLIIQDFWEYFRLLTCIFEFIEKQVERVFCFF